MTNRQGHTIPAWGGRRATQALHRVKHDGRHHNKRCVICDQPINYSLTYPHPQSCSVQHIPSRHERPDLTWNPAAWFPAHLDCNQGAGDGIRTRTATLGLTSQ